MSFLKNLIQADNMRSYCSVLISLLCLLQSVTGEVIAQNNTADYTVLHYNSDNSIIQNNTWAVEFDKQGYCWIGMENSIVRYDGHHFKAFDKKNIPGLTSSIFTSIIADKQGNLYARDDLGSLIKIETGKGKGSYAAIENSHLLLGRKGWLYKGDRYKTILARFCDSNKIKALEDYRRFDAVNDSTIYFYDANKLWYVCGNKVKALYMSSPIDATDGVLLNNTLFGDTLISVHKNNMIECFCKGEAVKTITHISGAIASDAGFLQGAFSVLWCRNGSFIYTNKKLYSIFFKDNALQSALIFSNLPAMSPVSFYYHPALNMYFLPTTNDGLFILKKTTFSTFTARNDNRYNNAYYTIANMPGNRIAANNFLFDTVGNAAPFYLADSRLRLMYNENDKGMWYACHDSLKYYSFSLKKNTVELKYKKAVISYCVSQYDSSLYFSSGFSIFKLSKNNTEAQYILNGDAVFNTKEEQIPRNKISCFGMYAAGQFIVGTYNGLYTLNSRTQKIKKLAGGIQVRKIYCDAQGDAWIGTSGNGFYCYSKGALTSFQPDYGKNFYSFYEFLEDDNGQIWLSSNNGIIRAKKQNLLSYCKDKNTYVHYDFFDKNDGLPSNEFNGGGTNCAIKLTDGKMIFSGTKGLVSFDPVKFDNASSQAAIYIDDIVADNMHPAFFQHFKLPASFSSLSFSVSAPQFSNTSDNMIEYAVAGLNDEWKPLPDNGSVTFNKMPHGSYTLRLRKGNGTSGYTYAETAFAVKPYFYQTALFKILSVIVLCVAVYFFVRLRVHFLYEQKTKLENLVHVRTGELNRNISMLQNTIKELETSEEKIYQNSKFKEKLISIILHDLRSPLRFISSVSGNLAAEYKAMPVKHVKESLNSLAEESANVYHFTNEFLTWIYTQQSDYVICNKAIDIDALFANIQNLYYKIAEQNNNVIHVAPSQIFCNTDESILKIIIRNLVDNAAKYTRNGAIRLDAIKKENNIVVSIADDGAGISESVWLALQKNTISENNDTKKTLGLLLVQELIKKLNGTVQFISNKPAGTIAEISLPA